MRGFGVAVALGIVASVAYAEGGPPVGGPPPAWVRPLSTVPDPLAGLTDISPANPPAPFTMEAMDQNYPWGKELRFTYSNGTTRIARILPGVGKQGFKNRDAEFNVEPNTTPSLAHVGVFRDDTTMGPLHGHGGSKSWATTTRAGEQVAGTYTGAMSVPGNGIVDATIVRKPDGSVRYVGHYMSGKDHVMVFFELDLGPGGSDDQSLLDPLLPGPEDTPPAGVKRVM